MTIFDEVNFWKRLSVIIVVILAWATWWIFIFRLKLDLSQKWVLATLGFICISGMIYEIFIVLLFLISAIFGWLTNKRCDSLIDIVFEWINDVFDKK